MDRKRVFLVFCVIIGLMLAGCQTKPMAGYSAPREIDKISPGITELAQMMTATSEIPPILEIHDIAADIAEPMLCGQDFCQLAQIGKLQRPIKTPGNVLIDWSYPYASTNYGTLDIHHGVEFQNAFGTIVLAAADGEVVFAGMDDQHLLGPKKNFYGNVVILRHPTFFEGSDVFTLYGHLSMINVKIGDRVKTGAPLGEVGASGVANGPHLHFEVRFEANDYDHTVNPALWFSHLPAVDAEFLSTLAGIIVDGNGKLMSEAVLTLEKLADDGAVQDTMYVTSYQFFGINSHPLLGENFAISDLQPGAYRLSFVDNQLYELFFSLVPGTLAFVTFQID